MLKKIINDKIDNIGSLCLYVKKREYLLKEIKFNFKENIKLSQRLWCFYNNNYKIYCKCGNLKKWLGFKYGWRLTCGDKNCINESRKKTNLERYGKDNPLKNDDIKNKIKKTNLERYGFEHPMMVDKIKNKFKNTMLKNHNCEYPLQSDIIKNKVKINWNNKSYEELKNIKNKKRKEWDKKTLQDKEKIINKRKKTNLERYGVNSFLNCDKVKNKIKKKYDIINTPFENKDIRKKASINYKKNKIDKLKNKLKDKKCEYINHDNENNGITYYLKCIRKNKNFKISYTNLRLRLLNNMEISPFYYKKKGISEMEKDLRNFILLNCDKNILMNVKNIIHPYELDIYIPCLKLAFEFNGTYWHSNKYKLKNYHLIKTELCEKSEIQLIHIYEDDWVYKQNIIKSIILNKLNKSNTIDLDECEIKDIKNIKLIKDFLNKNHINGYIRSKTKIGLFYENKLISLIIFNKTKNGYKLLRYCNKLNVNIIGNFDKLFNYFNKNNIFVIIDRTWDNINFYLKMGFIFENKIGPKNISLDGNLKIYNSGFIKLKKTNF